MKRLILLLLAILLVFSSVKAQTIDAKYFNAMKWRMIGPHRGGRTVGAAGVGGCVFIVTDVAADIHPAAFFTVTLYVLGITFGKTPVVLL